MHLAANFCKRTLHSCVPREAVIEAIKDCLPPAQQKAPGNVRFGVDWEQDFKIIQAASQAAAFSIPDCDLASFKISADLIEYLCNPLKAPEVKGVPKFELFCGDELPPNVLMINYRKRRWDNAMYNNFLFKAFDRVKLHPNTLARYR